MKKILLIMMASFIFLMALPLSSAFAYQGGLLNGKSMYIGFDEILNNGANNLATDNNTTTVVTLGKNGTTTNDTLWHEFQGEYDVDSYQLQTNLSAFEILFYDSEGLLIKVLDPLAVDRGGVKRAVTVKGVKKVALHNTSTTSAGNVTEFDVWGVESGEVPISKMIKTPQISPFNKSYLTSGGTITNFPVTLTGTDGTGGYTKEYAVLTLSAVTNVGKIIGSKTGYKQTFAFYDSSGTLIPSGVTQQDTSTYEQTFTNSVKNVKYITVSSQTSNQTTILNSYRVYEGFNTINYDPINTLTETHTTHNAVTLKWDNPTGEEFIGAIIKKDGVQVADLEKTINTYEIKNLSPETSYNFEVIAKYSDGVNSTAKSITATTNAAEKAGEIIELTATAEPEKVDLSWKLPESIKFKHVNIYRDTLVETSLIDKVIGTRIVNAAAETKIFETNGTYFNDLTVEPETTYEYTLTTTSTEGAESEGVSTEVTTPSPQIEGAGYTKELETGDFIYYWDKPTTGEVKVMLGGSNYKTVSAATKQILIPKTEMKYTAFGDPDVSLIPIASNGVEGTPEKPSLNGEGSADSIANAKIPFSATDLLNSGLGLLLIIAPFVLLALAFLVVPKLRRTLFAAFNKKNSPEERKRRFNDDGTPKETKERKEQRERKEKAEQEKRERKERTEREKREQRERKERTEREKRLAKGYEKEKPLIVEKAPRFAKEPRARREKVGRSERQQRPQRERSTRERTTRAERG